AAGPGPAARDRDSDRAGAGGGGRAMSPLHLAVELDGDGAHPAAWRRARHAPADLLTARRTAEVVRRAENAGFTLATFDDAPVPPSAVDGPGPAGRIGAVERAA